MRNYLFSEIDSYQYFTHKTQQVAIEVNSLEREELNNSDDSIKIILKAKYQIKLIEFGDYYKEDAGETQVNVRNDPRFNAFHWRDINSEPVYKKGKCIKIHLPFFCEPGLFDIKPSTYSTVIPQAIIKNNELVFTFDFFSDLDNPKDFKQKIDNEVDLAKKYSNWLNNDIQEFNNNIEGTIIFNLHRRREKIQKDEEFINTLDIPVKRDNNEIGFVKPERKLQLRIIKETPKKEIDPSLELETYEEIIRLINSFGINLERSSDRIRELGEEPLRDTFLSVLNSVYEGMATGEAFNKSGKTDILLKYLNSNLFVAECKIWKGDIYFKEGIDQLLSYLTWRDSKTSYIIFSKNQKISNVIEKSKLLLKQHPNFLKEGNDISESSSRYVFRNINDDSKELLLTLNVFDLN